MGLQRERDGRARDTDVAGGKRQDPGEVERGNDDQAQPRAAASTPNAAAMPAAAASRSAIASPTQPTSRAAARGQRPRTRKASRTCANAAAGPRRAGPPGDERRDEHAEQQCRDRPARQHSARRSEREHDREPERPDGAERRRNAADRPEPPLAVQHAREEREANRGPDPRRRERVHERAGAVARGRVGRGRRAAAARQRRSPSRTPRRRASPRTRLRPARARPARRHRARRSPRRRRSPSSCGVIASTSSAAIEPRKSAA